MAKERIIARARTQYTDYMVKEPMELMEFLAAKMPDASQIGRASCRERV